MTQQAILPQNIEAEICVLGSIIFDPEAIVMVGDFLKPIHFYRDAHQTIYSTIISMYNRGEAVDFLTLCDELDRTHKLEAVGGGSAISEMVNAVPTSANIEFYARIVVRNWTLRALIQASGEIAARAYAEDDEALMYGEKTLAEIARGNDPVRMVSGGEAANDYVTSVINLAGKGRVLSGLPTGYPLLDVVIGGLERAKLYILAGSSGDGKTTVAFNIVDAVVQAGYRVLFFSLEMDRNELMQRWVSMRSCVNGNHLRDNTLTDEELERVISVGTELEATKHLLMIDDTPGNTTTAMRQRAVRLEAEQGLDLIVLDYIGIAKVPSEDRKFHNERRLEVEEVVTSMKNLARELNIPVIALSQLNRETKKQADKMPGLHNLAEAAAVENNANVVMLIHRDQEAEPDATEYNMDLVVDKNRSGRKARIRLRFVGAYTKVYPINSFE